MPADTEALQAGPSAEEPSIIADPHDAASHVFDPSVVRTYELQVAPEDLAFLDQQPSAEQYVEAMLLFEGQQYGPIGMRYKGSVGGFLAPCTSGNLQGPKLGKCSIKLSFNWLDPEGRFYDLKKVNLHSMGRDPSLMRDRLGYTLFRRQGIPAPRAVHARLKINGQLEGLFALVEQIDGRFTRSRFAEGGKGNLYKEVWPIHDDESVYLAALESNRDEMPSARAFVDFKAAIGQGIEATERWLEREPMVDHIAVDRVLMNDDGPFHFWCGAGGQGNNPGGTGNHNYYWYQAERGSRLWLIPWDLDNLLKPASYVHIQTEWRAEGACSCADAGYYAPSCDPLIRLWGQHWSTHYEAAVDRFLAGAFSPEVVSRELAEWEAQIRPFVVEAAGRLGAPAEAEWQAALLELRTIIDSARAGRGFAY